jgi:hypothetical protein
MVNRVRYILHSALPAISPYFRSQIAAIRNTVILNLVKIANCFYESIEGVGHNIVSSRVHDTRCQTRVRETRQLKKVDTLGCSFVRHRSV